MSRASGRSKRTLLGVRGVRGSGGGLVFAWPPGWITRSSSSSSEREERERRPRSSSLLGVLGASPSLRAFVVLPLAIEVIAEALWCGMKWWM